MNRISDVRSAMEQYHRQRNRQAVAALLWLMGFSLVQGLRLGVVVALVAAGYAFFADNWAIFSAGNAFLVALALIGLGPLVTWLKIRAA